MRVRVSLSVLFSKETTMKKLMILAAIAALACVGCKTDKPSDFPFNVNSEFYSDVAYVGYAEGSGTIISGVDFPVPSGTKLKLWHMVKTDGTAYIGTKIEEKILWFIPLEYGKHVWRVRPGEWDDPGSKLGKAWDWANCLDKGWGHRVSMDNVGRGASFRRITDGYIEGFSTEYTCWVPRANSIKEKKTNSAEQTHWVNHIHDETVFWPNSAAMWANVHGFQEGGEGNWTYWIGIDIRTFGIRSADYVMRFKNKATYDYFLNVATRDMEHVLQKMRNDSRMSCRLGTDVNIEFVFRWGDDDKSFDVHLAIDDYAEEK